jgi:hypothetical protein
LHALASFVLHCRLPRCDSFNPMMRRTIAAANIDHSTPSSFHVLPPLHAASAHVQQAAAYHLRPVVPVRITQSPIFASPLVDRHPRSRHCNRSSTLFRPSTSPIRLSGFCDLSIKWVLHPISPAITKTGRAPQSLQPPFRITVLCRSWPTLLDDFVEFGCVV